MKAPRAEIAPDDPPFEITLQVRRPPPEDLLRRTTPKTSEEPKPEPQREAAAAAAEPAEEDQAIEEATVVEPVEPPEVVVPPDEPGSPGTGEVARREAEGRPGPPTVLGVGASPPPGERNGLGGEGEGFGMGSRTRGKGGALDLFGGTKRTEDAVARGLLWLAAHQDGDGGWSAEGFTRHCGHFSPCMGKGLGEFDVGVTALSTLAFLGAGHAPGLQGPYRANVEKALASILASQDARGAFGARGMKFLYNHAVATFAICEAYAMTRNRKFIQPAIEALSFSASCQQPGGGWDYTEASTDRNDLSITVWQVMAFHAAEAAGLPLPGGLLDRVRGFLARASTSSGEGIYANKGIGAGRMGVNMAAAALLSKLYTGTPPGDSWVEIAADRLIKNPPDRRLLYDWERHFQSSYYWYSATLCLFHLGGKRWEAWNHFLKLEVLPLQSLAPHEEGSWAPDPNLLGSMGGRIYTTAMNVLTLEIYYRYPPLYAYGGKGRPAR
jgi:hypothetical protein